MEWRTPQDLFDKLDSVFRFKLDAAASKENAKCDRFFTKEDDSLKQSWDFGGSVFCNPPYGKEIGKFVKKAYEESRNGFPIVLLIPARTDTLWFHSYIYNKAYIHFLCGRLRFLNDKNEEENSAPFPSMLVIYNPEAR